jgi:hypothetical protein
MSEQLKRSKIDLYGFDIKCSMEARLWLEEPDDYVSEYRLDLFYDPDEDETDEETDEAKIAGVLLACKVRSNDALIDKEPLRNVFDCHSEGLLDYYKALYDPITDVFKQEILDQFHILGVSDLLIINTCVLAPKWRGQNLGWIFVRRAMHLLGSGCELVVCDPNPLDVDDAKTLSLSEEWFHRDDQIDVPFARLRLRKYWAGMGFQEVENNYLVASIDNVDCPTLKQLVKQTPLNPYL